MKTIDEFQSFYDSGLTGVLNELEHERKKIVGFLPFVLLGIGGIVAAAIGFAFDISTPILVIIIIACLALTIVFIVKMVSRRRSLRANYKEKVIREIIQFLSDDLTYTPAAFISQGEFQQSKIFLNSINRYRGDDLVTGKLDKTSIQFSELHAEYYTTNSKGQRQYHTIFKGIFFSADFNKHFIGETVVLTDVAERLFGKFGSLLQKMNISRPELIKLEDPEFEKAFAVYGTDQVEARYILTPAMMSRIMEFKKKTGTVNMSFLHSKVYIAINVSKDLFEPSFFKSMLNFELVKEYFNYLVLCVEIVEDLDLNTRIWSKE